MSNNMNAPTVPPASSSQNSTSGLTAKVHMSLVSYKHLRFVIFDAPSSQNVGAYLNELKSYGVSDVVRVCEPTYDKSIFEFANIAVHDWPFTDGEAPPKSIVQSWLALVDKKFGGLAKVKGGDSPSLNVIGNPFSAGSSSTLASSGSSSSPPCIGVHCVAGLGRAPVLVAMALIESGMAPLDSVIFIRERRRGAINARQLKYIEAYKRQGKKECCIM